MSLCLGLGLAQAGVPETRTFFEAPESEASRPPTADLALKTVVCPAWGSWGQGHPFLTAAQAAFDGLAVAAIASDLAFSAPDAGSGMLALAGLAALAAHRLVALPINLYVARPGAPDAGPGNARRRPEGGLGLIAALGDYGDAPGLGLDIGFRYGRVRGVYGFSRRNAYYAWQGPDSIYHSERLERGGFWDLGIEGNIRVTEGIRLRPGLQALSRDYGDFVSDQQDFAPYAFLRNESKSERGWEWVPSVAVAWRPAAFPIALEAGAGWSLGTPSLETGYLDRERAHGGGLGDGFPGNDHPLRWHLAFETCFWPFD